jgi:hypothetical protein
MPKTRNAPQWHVVFILKICNLCGMREFNSGDFASRQDKCCLVGGLYGVIRDHSLFRIRVQNGG